MPYVIGTGCAGPVPPAPFGDLKRSVCDRDQAAPIAACSRSLRRYAGANGDDSGTAPQMWNPQVFHTFPDALRDCQRALLVSIFQNQREFLATVPGHYVCGALGQRINGSCNHTQAVVAILMAVVVVIALVRVDIDHDNGHVGAAVCPSGLSPLK